MNLRVWAEVDLAAVRYNVAEIRALVGNRTGVMAVVKANGYGHGAVEIGGAAIEAGAAWLGAAGAQEGASLRERFPDIPICLFGPSLPDEAEAIVGRRLTPLLSDRAGAAAIDLAAQTLKSPAYAHLEVDCGMGRSGVVANQIEPLARQLARLPSLVIDGLATHFPSADCDEVLTASQVKSFLAARASAEKAGLALHVVHAANSAATLRHPESRFDLVRPGLLLYGIVPAGVSLPEGFAPRPVLSLKTRIALVRPLPAGHTISYHGDTALARDSRVATLPVGYGDGYPRSLSGAGGVLVAGKRAPILGRVCMDMTVVDVTDIPEAAPEAETVLIGRQGAEEITVAELARMAGTTEHDITTRLAPRVARVYLSCS